MFGTWKWGDWRHSRKYQSTMLYAVGVSLLYEFLTVNYPIWVFSDFWLPSHTLNSLIVTLIGIPLSVLIFLSRFPEHSIRKQIIHVLWWVLLYAAIELFWVIIGLFHYYHGWTFWWSVLFDCIMFPMVRLHYKRPLLAFAISIPIVITFMVVFHVPILK
ncbi:CBO0543 family protein [Alicyclobacillus fastidiosus]|uniref:CBO0543 family protein n=1 Tax=Alicyclobacillus fastidiosus TaxID=392011 RepID=UPI0034DCF593